MPERFYAPVSFDAPVVELAGSEAHHLKDVLRLGVGEQVLLLDGRGTEAQAEVASVGKRTVSLKVIGVRTVQTTRPLVLATAIPKGDRFRFLVEKATELGVSRLIPLATERSVVVPRDVKLDKMRQTVIAASKQCGRAHFMQIAAVRSWKEFVECEFSGNRVLIAHPAGEPIAGAIAGLDRQSPILAAIGPEGGFTQDEIDKAVAAGARPVSLGENILRIETAAIALCALLLLPAADR